MFTKMIDKWLARRAFNALRLWMDRGGLDRIEYDHCVTTLDVLRSKMWDDYKLTTWVEHK